MSRENQALRHSEHYRDQTIGRPKCESPGAVQGRLRLHLLLDFHRPICPTAIETVDQVEGQLRFCHLSPANNKAFRHRALARPDEPHLEGRKPQCRIVGGRDPERPEQPLARKDQKDACIEIGYPYAEKRRANNLRAPCRPAARAEIPPPHTLATGTAERDLRCGLCALRYGEAKQRTDESRLQGELELDCLSRRSELNGDRHRQMARVAEPTPYQSAIAAAREKCSEGAPKNARSNIARFTQICTSHSQVYPIPPWASTVRRAMSM